MTTTSEIMGQTKKAKITFTCTQEARNFLENWAAAERRTISNLVEGLVDDAITAKGEPINPVPPPDESNATVLLKLLASGKRPEDGELLEVAHKTGIREEELIQLRDHLFPNGNPQEKKKATNGI